MAGEIHLSGLGSEADPLSAPRLDWAQSWLTGGAAILDQDHRLLEINEPLRQWLASRTQEPRSGADFWALLVSLEPAWQAPIAAVVAESSVFSRVELQSQTVGGGPAWFSLELARQPSACFVQLNSVLPPGAALQEAPAQECLPTPEAGRQLLVRLLRAEERLENLVRRWPGVIFNQRADLAFQFVTPKIEELTGIPVDQWKRLPQRFWEVVHESDAEHVQQQLKLSAENGESVSSVYRIRHAKTRRVTYVLEHRQAVRTRQGLLLGYEGVWLDVTRQTIAEKRLSTAAWKETLSVLTMGLAHDFSNIMAGIHSLSESFLSQVEPHHPFHEGLALIKGNSIQASQLIQRILHLHHGKIGERQYQNLSDLVRETVELVRKIVPRRVRVETAFAPEALPVYADAVEFRQVLINLVLNALDAMPQGGLLRLLTERVDAYPQLMHVEGALPRLPSVCLVAQDEGCGIPAKQLASIFDPFYTTKSPDKGSGLGLYNARLFAEKHHGAISVDSEPSKGTTIRVWLPEADFTEADRSAGEPGPSVSRRALLVFAKAGSALDHRAEGLRESGFLVVTTTAVGRAAEFLQRNDHSFAGVLLLVGGSDDCYRQIASLARAVAPSAKVIVEIAGCNQDEAEADLLQNADLVLGPGLPRAEHVARIQALWADAAKPSL